MAGRISHLFLLAAILTGCAPPPSTSYFLTSTLDEHEDGSAIWLLQFSNLRAGEKLDLELWQITPQDEKLRFRQTLSSIAPDGMQDSVVIVRSATGDFEFRTLAGSNLRWQLSGQELGPLVIAARGRMTTVESGVPVWYSIHGKPLSQPSAYPALPENRSVLQRLLAEGDTAWVVTVRKK